MGWRHLGAALYEADGHIPMKSRAPAQQLAVDITHASSSRRQTGTNSRRQPSSLYAFLKARMFIHDFDAKGVSVTSPETHRRAVSRRDWFQITAHGDLVAEARAQTTRLV
jgi:hypothetical protein